jgi:citrate synthase
MSEQTEYSKGLAGVIANESCLSDVMGEAGILRYLGYNIQDLVEKCSFEEVMFLLHRRKLPTQAELDAFTKNLRSHRHLPGAVIDFLKSAPRDASPMDVLRTGVSMLGLYDHRGEDQDRSINEDRAMAICATMPLIVAHFHRARQGLDLMPVRDDFSAITSAIGTLKGPLHGGANEGVIHMLQEIGSLDKVDAYVDDCLAHKKKIMGIGHRVYKVLDPRAPFLRKMAVKLTKELGESKWIDMSERIAQLMKERKGLNANVDFYSATVYYSLGIPTDLFTPIFAIARAAGWTAQVLEQLDDNRLYRPLTLYTGPTEDQPIPPMSERG